MIFEGSSPPSGVLHSTQTQQLRCQLANKCNQRNVVSQRIGPAKDGKGKSLNKKLLFIRLPLERVAARSARRPLFIHFVMFRKYTCSDLNSLGIIFDDAPFSLVTFMPGVAAMQINGTL